MKKEMLMMTQGCNALGSTFEALFECISAWLYIQNGEINLAQMWMLSFMFA